MRGRKVSHETRDDSQPLPNENMFNSSALPPWLIATAWIAIGAGLGSALWITIDIAVARPQRMTIMNIVWPLTAL